MIKNSKIPKTMQYLVGNLSKKDNNNKDRIKREKKKIKYNLVENNSCS